MLTVPGSPQRPSREEDAVKILRLSGFGLCLLLAFLAGTLVPTASTQTSTQISRPRYVRVDYMKIPVGRSAEYRSLEIDLWKPVHQLRLKEGLISSWALYGHHFPGGALDYQYVTVTEFPTLRSMDADRLDYPRLFGDVYPSKSYQDIQKQTEDSRILVQTDIWALLESVD